MKSPQKLVRNQKNFTEMILMLPSEGIAWLNNMATKVKNRNTFKSYHISLATGQYIIYSCVRTQVSACYIFIQGTVIAAFHKFKWLVYLSQN